MAAKTNFDAREFDYAACPRPEKIAFSSKRQAKITLRHWRRTPGLTAYRCPCGAYHLGHPSRVTW